ncbi:MAG: hypothetical protein K6F05_00465 [Succinivibrio sp.]|nr:hypothetical protein [Succinivibrio sp.]
MRLSLLYKPLLNALRFKLARWRYDYAGKPLPQGKFSFAKLRHVVLVKSDGKLGDTQIISLFIDVLKRSCPQLKLSVLCPVSMRDIYADILKVNVLEVKKRPSFAELRDIVSRLEALAPVDMLISTERLMRPRDLYLAFLCKPEVLVGMDAKVRCINYQLVGSDEDFKQHILCYFLDLLKAGGLEPREYGYHKLFRDAELQYAKKLFAGAEAIGILPFGAAADKRLSYETILSICRYLQSHTSLTLVPLLTAAEEETLSRLKADLDPQRLLLLPKLSIPEFAACIACLKALVSVDTAGVHLAVAAGIPVLGLYQGFGTEAILWQPGPLATQNSVLFRESGKVISAISYAALEPELEKFVQGL